LGLEQTVLQLPQWFGSVSVLTQTVPHAVSPDGQTQVPFWQAAPEGH
jgi:hypothetical protein